MKKIYATICVQVEEYSFTKTIPAEVPDEANNQLIFKQILREIDFEGSVSEAKADLLRWFPEK